LPLAGWALAAKELHLLDRCGFVWAHSKVELVFSTASSTFFAVNDALMTVAIVGATNLWAQGGMRARDVVVIAAAVALYDIVSTSGLPLMGQLISHLVRLPLAPILGWPTDSDGSWLGIALGDMLLATVFPLVMGKAFGSAAGLTALGCDLAGIASLLGLPIVGILHVEDAFPAMVVLAPLMVLQYVFWIRRNGAERTTWQYLHAEPRYT